MAYGPVKKREIIKRLRKAGFYKVPKRGSGSHDWFQHDDGRCTAIRNQKEFFGGPLQDIESQTGVKMID
jgi:predicted RNA binding protein YcfA (HicA-like mRNA interferase family)